MAVDPRKKIVEKVVGEVAEAGAGLIKKVTKPKTTKGKTPGKPKATVTGTTAPGRTPKAQPAVTPTVKPSARTQVKPSAPAKISQPPRITRKDVKSGLYNEAEYQAAKAQRAAIIDANKRAAAKRASERAAARKAEAASRSKTKPSGTPKKQTTGTKPGATLGGSKGKKSTGGKKKTTTAPVTPNIPGVTVAKPGSPVSYLDEGLGDEFALAAQQRALQEATQEAAGAAAPGIRRFGAIVDEAAPVATQAAEEGVETAIETAAKRGIRERLGAAAAGAKGTVTGAGLGARPLVVGGTLAAAPGFIPEDAPEWMKTAANIGAVAGGALALRGLRGVNRLGQLIRGGTALTGATAIPRLMGPGETPAAADTIEQIPVESVISPSDIIPGETPTGVGGPSPEEQYLQGIQEVINTMTQDAETEAVLGTAEVESKADAALQQLIDLYGGMANVQAATAANDPILAQELAAIEADYNAGMAQIANNYNAAIYTVQQYQQQVDSAFGLLGGQLRQSMQAAAGGLEMGGIPTGLIGGEAAMSGISDTALGGAGITGAALTRALGEAGQAGITADQMGAQIDLGTALAQGTISQADLQAALGRDRLAALTGSRRAAAERAAEERIRQQELAREGALTAATLRYERELAKEEKAAARAQDAADRKYAAAQFEAEAKMSLAQMVANMTPEEYARWKGSSAGKASSYKTPSWFGKRLQGAPDKTVSIKLAALPATIGTVNDALDMVDATLASEAARNPLTALATWQKFYETLDPDIKRILQSRGIPTNAGAMYKELFKTTPSK